MMRHKSTPIKAAGFTLVEAVMVIAITGVIAAMVAVFIRAPVEGYLDSSRRAELTDIADTTMRRMSRDLRLALPNSIRVAGATCIEFLPTVSGGRYRAEQDCSSGGSCSGNKLDFEAADDGFDFLGGLNPLPSRNDRVVVYNLGIDGANAYANQNTATIESATATGITFTTSVRFPFESPGSRFYVIPNADRVASYTCAGLGLDAAGNGTGILYRLSNYVPSALTPSACPTIPAGTPILARNLTACTFAYDPGVTARSGLASLQIAVTKNNETVNLYHEVHVNNAP